MKRIFFIIVTAFFCIGGIAQTKDSSDPSTTAEVHPEHPAEFPGGNKEWVKYLEHNLNHDLAHKYLTIPKGEKSVKQTVKMLFEIDTKGKTTNITVENIKDVHPELAREGIRIIIESPAWKPASQDGKPVPDKRRQKLSFMWGTSF
jgi:protein TonB